MGKFSLVEKNSALPEPTYHSRLFQRAAQAMHSHQAALRHNSAGEKLAALNDVLPHVQTVLSELQELGRRATKTEIAKHLALLVKSIPNPGGAADGEIYGRMLVEDISADQPAIGDLQDACRQIRRTSTFLPSIAEVFTEIGEAQNRRRSHLNQMTGIIESKKELESNVERERRVANLTVTALNLIRSRGRNVKDELNRLFPGTPFVDINEALELAWNTPNPAAIPSSLPL